MDRLNYLEKYDWKGRIKSCLNCGKESCDLSRVGNVSGENENNGCWEQIKEVSDSYGFQQNR